MSDSKQEQDLVEMLSVLRQFLGNRTTSTTWFRHMQEFYATGWSKAAFKRRLKILKHRKWIGIVGEPNADLERAPEGSLFETTVIAPGASAQPGSNWDTAMNGAADAAAKAAMELLQRLNKGKPPHAA